MDIGKVQEFLRDFADQRDWYQFHTPKNLVMALAGEAGELSEIFQWLTPDESINLVADERRRQQVEEELADILQYVIRIGDILDVDLEKSLWAKLQLNEERYPVEKVRSSARKYTELEDDLSE